MPDIPASGTTQAEEAEPAAAAEVFGDRLDLARRYVQWLVTAGVERGLMGPREGARMWSRHVLNCAVVGEAIGSGLRVVDIGSGAGLPGVCLAIARPDLNLVLIEPLLRRSDFLGEVVADLGLSNCTVVRGRAEEVAGAVGGADVLTARAVAPLAKLARWGAPLLRVDGSMVVMKGSSASEEVARDEVAVRRAGIVDLTVVEVGGGVVDPPTIVVVGRRVGAEQRRRNARR